MLSIALQKGKAADPDESIEEDTDADVPVDLFKGFSFAWNPNQARESFLSEGIDVLRSEASTPSKPKKSKNRVVMNFFLWAKEIQGLPGKQVGKPISIRWKHESKKYVTLIGPSDDSHEVNGETAQVDCNDSRSVIFEGAMDNACIACDYLMLQDRKTLAFDSRIITFQLMAYADKKKRKMKPLGKLSIDLRDYSFHKREKTLIFAFGDSGATLVLSIFCCWKSFNGDLVDNYETHLKGKFRTLSEGKQEGSEEDENEAKDKKTKKTSPPIELKLDLKTESNDKEEPIRSPKDKVTTPREKQGNIKSPRGVSPRDSTSPTKILSPREARREILAIKETKEESSEEIVDTDSGESDDCDF